jgi:hypothetical protein
MDKKILGKKYFHWYSLFLQQIFKGFFPYPPSPSPLLTVRKCLYIYYLASQAKTVSFHKNAAQ